MPFNQNAFLEELIQLQLKYMVVLEGYDVSFWTEDEGIKASEMFKNKDPSMLVTEEKIRDRWEYHLIGNVK